MDTFDRKSYITIAKDLCYSEDVIKKLKKAKTEDEARRIMTSARERDINSKRGWL